MAFGCPIGELQRRMTYVEFVEWAAYLEVEPIGNRRLDLHVARLMTLLANVNRDPKRRAYQLDEFLIDWWGERRSPENVLAKFRAISERINAQVANAND